VEKDPIGEGVLQSVAKLAGGTAVSRLLVLMAAPLLTRIYTPNDFGLLAVYASILNIAVILSSLRFEFAIPLPAQDDIAVNLMAVAFAVLLGWTAILAFGTVIFEKQLLDALGRADLAVYLWIFPVGMFLSGAYNLLTYWAVRKKAFGQIAWTNLTQSISMSLSQLILGLLSAGPLGLLIGQVLGSSSGSLTLAKLTKEHLGRISVQRMWSAIRSYRQFPLLSSPASLLNAAVSNLPTVFLSAVYGLRTAGLYMLVQRVIGIPMTLIGTAVAKVYFSEAPKLLRENPQKLRSFFLMLSSRLLVVSLIPGLLLIFGGPWFFSLAFGSEWGTAGMFAQILSVTFVSQFVTSPLSHTLIVTGKQSWQLCWDAGRFLALFLCFSTSYTASWSPAETLLAYSAIMFAGYGLLFFMSNLSIQKAEGL
jgi:O-antigen/teichoic acid export membrane protein